jgi:ketosteroid isomerase-like protein
MLLPISRRRTRVGKEEEASVSSAEENRALARRFIEARVEGDLDALDEMLAPDFVTHTRLVAGQPHGREGEKWAISQLTATLSNRSVLVEDQIASGDKVASRFVVHETHDIEELMGVAPSGKAMTNKTIMIHRIEGGKIAEEWSLGTLGLKLRGQHLEQERIKRECVDQELRVARRIQQASLPEKVPTLEGWQISPFYQPAREVGGDFYDFHLLSEGRLGLVVGDATGKGVPAALVMSTTCRQSPKPWIPLRLGRYSLGSTRRCFYASLPTCWSPASTPF